MWSITFFNPFLLALCFESVLAQEHREAEFTALETDASIAEQFAQFNIDVHSPQFARRRFWQSPWFVGAALLTSIGVYMMHRRGVFQTMCRWKSKRAE
jgi:hypothetical protein